MKYGIVATYNDGTQKYCSSGRGGRISLSSDIDDIALFVQESSAVKALKQARKNGAERKNGCSLAVVEVGFNVVKTIDVPQPPAKPGFIIKRVNTRQQSEAEYYTGIAKISYAYTFTGWDVDAIESATVFKTDLDAQRVIGLFITSLEEDLRKKQAELEKARSIATMKSAHNYWHKDPKYLEDELQGLERKLEATRAAEIVAV